ncbi:MAG: hypothetical protein JSS10_00465 [Verrucomicrobia bacterium]|nr:hypothetical protein [Verrucomicrobiota bacterium]
MSIKGLPPYSAHYLTLNETISFLREKKDKAEVYSFSEQTLKEDVPVRLPTGPDIPQNTLPKQTIRWLLKRGFTPSFVKNEVFFNPPSSNFILLTKLPSEEQINALALVSFASFQILATCSSTGSIQLWNLNKKESVREIGKHPQCSVLTTYEYLMASGSQDGTIKIWNTLTQRLYCTLKTDSVAISALIFLNNKWLISSSKNGKIQLWDLSKQKCTHTQVQAPSSVNALLVCHKNKMLISGSATGNISIWEIDLELEVGRIMTKRTLKKDQEGHSDSVNALAFLPDGKIVSASSDKTLKIWDSLVSQCLDTYKTDSEIIDLCCPSSDVLCIKTKNNEIKICKISDLDPLLFKMSFLQSKDPWKHLSRLASANSHTNFMFLADGMLGSWCATKKRINVWGFSISSPKGLEKDEVLTICMQSIKELETGLSKITEPETKQNLGNYFANLLPQTESKFSQKERVQKGIEALKDFEKHLQANNSKEAKVSIQHAITLTCSTPCIQKVRRVFIAFIHFQGKIAQASFLYPDFKLLLREKEEKGKQIIQLNQEKTATVIKADQLSVENEKIRKEHQQALTQKQQEIQKLQTGYEKKIGLLTTISQLKLAKTISNLPEAIHKLIAFEDNLVGETTTGKALIWNIGTWERKPPKEGSSNDVFLNSFLQLTKNDSHPLTLAIPPLTTFTIHHSEPLLAFHSQKNTIQIISMADGKVVSESPKCSSAAKAMSFRDQYLAASFSDGIITVWDFKSFTFISSLKDLGDIKGIALLPNGLLAYAVGDTIFLRSLDDKSQIHRKLTGHSGSIRALLPFADEYLISGSEDRTIKFWDTTRNICIRTLESQKKILSLGLLPDQALISSNEDATIDIWK